MTVMLPQIPDSAASDDLIAADLRQEPDEEEDEDEEEDDDENEDEADDDVDDEGYSE